MGPSSVLIVSIIIIATSALDIRSGWTTYGGWNTQYPQGMPYVQVIPPLQYPWRTPFTYGSSTDDTTSPTLLDDTPLQRAWKTASTYGLVSCGGHMAGSCSACGSNKSFCNGDCHWSGGKCTARGSTGYDQLCSRSSPNGKRNMQLVDKINQYRSQLGRPALQCNKALAFTAEYHTRNQNDVDPSSGKCNLHSWFSSKFLGKGGRTCCYKEGHSNPACMWNKPEELHGYDVLNGEIGVENSCYGSGGLDADGAFDCWRGSGGHNDVMAGNGDWADLTRVGCFYYKNYANCWFAK